MGWRPRRYARERLDRIVLCRRLMIRTLATALLVLLGAAACASAPSDVGATPEYTLEDDDDIVVTSELPGPPESLAPVAALATPVPGCVARGSLAGHPTWLFFTNPSQPCRNDGFGADMNAMDELTRLIGSVPAGGRIDGHIFSINLVSVAQALLDAQTRGVDVWISADGGVEESTVKADLDKLANMVYCTHPNKPNNRSCISTADDAIAHTKLFVFSTAAAPDGAVSNNVVWFGSANQSHHGTRMYQNTVTVYGAALLYTQLRAYLGDLHAQERHADYHDPDSERGHLLSGAANVYASPEAQNDLVANRLDDITPDASCRIRVMQSRVNDSRLEVVSQLVKMKRNGCQVWVVADKVEPSALKALLADGISVRCNKEVHDKSFLVYAKYGSEYKYRIYSGSHNLGSPANYKNDEIFVKLAPETGTTHPLYDAYLTHFNDAYEHGDPPTQIACSGE